MTARDSNNCFLFVLEVAPGFDTGRHYHTVLEQFFYVIEGELNLSSGDRVLHANPGTFLLVSPGTPHSIANPNTKPARLLMGCLPAGHENYFDELAAILGNPGTPDPQAIAALRKKYDTIQRSSLQSK
jgi:quercetin dioxygenase-like cupin family protein